MIPVDTDPILAFVKSNPLYFIPVPFNNLPVTVIPEGNVVKEDVMLAPKAFFMLAVNKLAFLKSQPFKLQPVMLTFEKFWYLKLLLLISAPGTMGTPLYKAG